MPALRNLQVLVANPEIEFGMWSEDAFIAVALHPSITELTIPKILSLWFARLNAKGLGVFPKLSYLSVDMSEDAFERCVQVTKHLKQLYLTVTGPSRKACSIAAELVKLRELHLVFIERAEFNAKDILKLASTCQLTMFTLEASNFDSILEQPLIGLEIDDEVVEKFAMHLPSLELLQMHVDHAGRLTEKALLSLAKWCKGIKTIRMCADVDWNVVVDLKSRAIFPKLSVLGVLGNRLATCEDVTALVKKIRILAPRLETIAAEVSNAGTSRLTLNEAWRYVH